MSVFDDISDVLGSPTPEQGKYRKNDLNVSERLNLDENFYRLALSNWYTAKPYGFRMKTRDGGVFTMFLPIGPSNINITTPFATNMVTTLYGTVEEHSNNRYYDIVIEGTTGMAPRFVEPYKGEPDDAYKTRLPGRASFPLKNALLGGFFQNTIAQAQNIFRQSKKVVDNVNDLFGGSAPTPDPAVYADQTGYMAFHNLYRFLMKHKRDVSGVDSHNEHITEHPLVFFNYKDNNQYNVVVRSFRLTRSSENPMLYFYSISMRGYNMTTCGTSIIDDSLGQRLTDLGLDGVEPGNIYSKMKNISSGAKNVLGSLSAGINIFGS